jgi:hypothetical protein
MTARLDYENPGRIVPGRDGRCRFRAVDATGGLVVTGATLHPSAEQIAALHALDWSAAGVEATA